MVNFIFLFLYVSAVLILLWQAFRVMARGFGVDQALPKNSGKLGNEKGDRTGRLTIHPELLEQNGRITDEELLTVRFSEDIDPPQSAERSAE